MPELPEVETVRKGLEQGFSSAQLKKIIVRRDKLRFAIPSDLQARLTGSTVTHYERRAKYLLWHLKQGDCLLMHLGMSGRLTIFDAAQAASPNLPSPEKHDHLEFHCHSGRIVRYNDPRRFGFVLLLAQQDLAQQALLARLGPEPLTPSFDAHYAFEQAQKRSCAIKALIMDQRFVVGVGNIYASEALFAAQIHPLSAANRLDLTQWQALVCAIKAVLSRAIEAGGSSLRDHRQTDGTLGYFQHEWKVYGRAAEACPRCQARISKITQQQRASYFCPSCQTLQARSDER